MTRYSRILSGAIALIPATACVDTVEDLDEDLLGVSESALCLAPTSPGTPSVSKTVTPGVSGKQRIDVSNYGTSECSRTTIEFKDTHIVDVFMTGLTTQSQCEAARVFATYFVADANGQNFVRDAILSADAEWDGTHCRIPYIPYNIPHSMVPYPTRTVRVVVSAQRTSCTTLPNGLHICGTTYGLPVSAWGVQ